MSPGTGGAVGSPITGLKVQYPASADAYRHVTRRAGGGVGVGGLSSWLLLSFLPAAAGRNRLVHITDHVPLSLVVSGAAGGSSPCFYFASSPSLTPLPAATYLFTIRDSTSPPTGRVRRSDGLRVSRRSRTGVTHRLRPRRSSPSSPG